MYHATLELQQKHRQQAAHSVLASQTFEAQSQTSCNLASIAGVESLHLTAPGFTICSFYNVLHPRHPYRFLVFQRHSDLLVPDCCQIAFHSPWCQTIKSSNKKDYCFFSSWEGIPASPITECITECNVPLCPCSVGLSC